VLAHAEPTPAANDWTAPIGVSATTALVRGSIRARVPVT
jgi:hypothetical protein